MKIDARAAIETRWFRSLGILLVSLLPFHGAFSLSRIFYIRDLSFSFWPLHVWMRDTILAGESPFWDPHIGFGQSVLPDPVKHLFFPPVLLLRVLFPDVVGFNLSVALAYPALAFGAYRLFRLKASPQAAALGALVVVTSGPIVSTGNFINISWSIVFVPWILFSITRLGAGFKYPQFVLLAVLFALQFLAGEPVTLVTTAALAVAYSCVCAHPEGSSWKNGLRAAAITVAAGFTGVLLASVQVFSLVGATLNSPRSAAPLYYGTAWAINPLTLVETIVPGLYGDPYWTGPAGTPWLNALNNGLPPYLYSVYLGISSLCLAAIGARTARSVRWSLFWIATIVVATLLAAGNFSSVYPLLREYLPFIGFFRSPSKFFLFVPFAVGALCAVGWDDVIGRKLSRPAFGWAAGLGAAAALSGLLAVLTMLFAPETAAFFFRTISILIDINPGDNPEQQILVAGFSGFSRLALLAAATIFFLYLAASDRPESPRARWLLFAIVTADLIAAAWWVNPTMDVAQLERPAWTKHLEAHPNDHTYIAGRLYQISRTIQDADMKRTKALGAEPVAYEEIMARDSVLLATNPSPWKIRDSFSIDNNALWPKEYHEVMRYFATCASGQRERFLSRAGVRYYFMNRVPLNGSAPLERIPEREPLALYEIPPVLERANLVPNARVEPDSFTRRELLFSEELDPRQHILLESESPAPAGTAGTGLPAAVRFLKDSPTNVVVEADVPDEGAFLLLLDSYDPHWTAEVDGNAAPVLRANTMFRAVRLAPGQHTIRFSYRPAWAYAGFATTLFTALVLLAIHMWRRNRAGSRRTTD